ncbi:uncharacterized protein N7518_001064 [Penicillium psychrosexuale]|uniref:uncharacterized protein n=1 Tax=Penicillium psychrosexuale TaxID=1002107 RepID=UPI0025455873|nr:uncharacterized protein N7518_001064 [Penicillium psychrosexuale]KAJ5804761.1 hypothetical protein N7518_001064 [Penicillium psychrosexuale]
MLPHMCTGQRCSPIQLETDSPWVGAGPGPVEAARRSPPPLLHQARRVRVPFAGCADNTHASTAGTRPSDLGFDRGRGAD